MSPWRGAVPNSEELANLYVRSLRNVYMTSESTASSNETFDADNHDQEIKKLYYHAFDDDSVDKMKKYFKVEDDHAVFLRYLKEMRVPKTTPNDV
jgi:hypothetical protein